MKTKLHSVSIYPLILIFSSFLKGKKSDYSNFFINKESKRDGLQEDEDNIKLKVSTKDNEFYENIRLFFDKESPIYNKTFVNFEINTSKKPEEKSFYFDFFKTLNIYHALSMLSAKIPNENIHIRLKLKQSRLNDSQINHLLRYSLLAYASKKVDKLYFDENLLVDEKSQLAYKTMIEYLNGSTIVNFSNAKSLYVITCKKGKDTLDIVWSSEDEIKLEDANIVFDKYGKQLSKDVKISNSPIYAFHKKTK